MRALRKPCTAFTWNATRLPQPRPSSDPRRHTKSPQTVKMAAIPRAEPPSAESVPMSRTFWEIVMLSVTSSVNPDTNTTKNRMTSRMWRWFSTAPIHVWPCCIHVDT